MFLRLRGMSGTATLVIAVAMFTDSLIYSLLVPILPSYLDRLGMGESAAGALFAVFAVALLLSTPIMGVLCDRLGFRVPMLLGLFGLGMATLSFAVVESYWALLVARAAQGVASAATATSGLALLSAIYAPDKRGQAIGMALASNAAGTLMGPPLSGLLFDWCGHQAPFLSAAALAVLDGFGRILLIMPKAPPEESSLPARRILKLRGVVEILVIVVLGASGLTLLEAHLPLHLASQLALSPIVIGLLFAVATLAFGIASPIVGALSDKCGRLRIAYLGLFLSGLFLPLVILQDSLVWGFVTMAGMGVSLGIAITPTMPALADVIDREGGNGSYGVPTSLFNMAWAIGMIGGPVAGTVLAPALGLHAALFIIGGSLMLFVLKQLRSRLLKTGGIP